MQDKYYTLTNDVIFKYVFGSERNKQILLSLLNSIMVSAGNPELSSIEYVNPINLKEYINDKITIMDLKATDDNGRRYSIEMQVRGYDDFLNRIIYYNDRLYTEQLVKAEAYSTLNKAISVSILDFNLLPNNTSIHNIFRYLNLETKKELTDLKELHFIELLKYDKDKPRILMTKFEKWLGLIKFGEKFMDNVPNDIDLDPEMLLALQEMRKANANPLVREIIELREKAEHDEASRLQQALRTGRDEGIEVGKKEGIEVGKKEGIEVGKKEGSYQQLVKTAQQLYSMGLDFGFISKAVEKPEDEIKKIIDGLRNN